jgi:hypothetical protein
MGGVGGEAHQHSEEGRALSVRLKDCPHRELGKACGDNSADELESRGQGVEDAEVDGDEGQRGGQADDEHGEPGGEPPCGHENRQQSEALEGWVVGERVLAEQHKGDHCEAGQEGGGVLPWAPAGSRVG